MNTIEDLYKNSNLRKNVLHWYPIKEDSTILQIGTDSPKIVEELCDKAKKVTLILNNESQKQDILNEISRKNLEIKVISNLEIKGNKEQYDYVTLIGSLEIYQDIIENKAYKRLKKLLEIAKQKCKENGKILLALDNKYGMKFWTTMYAQKNILCNQKFALSKTMINELLEKTGLTNYKYYYMLPDYKIANVIFTDKYMPNIESISRNFTYGEEEFLNFNQTEAYGEILKENIDLFKFYANSYFIEIGKGNLEENNIKFVSYTNIRKEQYRIQTTIYENRVEKTCINEDAREHINNMKRNIDIMNNIGLKTLDSYKEDKIISKYIENAKSYDKVLLEYLENEENDKFFEMIETYKKDLLRKLGEVKLEEIKNNNIFEKYKIECKDDFLNEFHFVKNGLWDLIFQNIFYINNELYFYDQEWYDENVPIEYIIYRSIAYFANAHAFIPTQELYKKLNINKYVETFQKLDSKIQEEIRNEEIWNLHNRAKTGQTLMDLYNNLQIEFNNYKQEHDNIDIDKIKELIKENNQMKEENKNLENKVESLKDVNEKILNSTSWKITKPIRWLGKNIK